MADTTQDPLEYIYKDLVSLDDEKDKKGGGLSFGATGSTGAAGGASGNSWMQYLQGGSKLYKQFGSSGSSSSGGDSGSSGGSGGSSNSGSWLGALSGVVAGYKAGKARTEENPAYHNGEDGFGTYHEDSRGKVGHTIGGAFAGYWTKGATTPFVDKFSKWSDAELERGTRKILVKADDIGGIDGAMMVDPIGAAGSGKYSYKDMFNTGLLGPLGKYLAAGGAVSGPGTTTSDSIPARLSDGEYVLNAEAVKLIGEDKLDELNAAGLRVRGGAKKSKPNHFANGGSMGPGAWSSFNQGLQAGYGIVDKYNEGKQQRQMQAVVDEQPQEATAPDGTQGYTYGGQFFTTKPTDTQVAPLKMNQMADVYARNGAADKAMALRGQALQYKEGLAQAEQRDRERTFVQDWRPIVELAGRDPVAAMDRLHEKYNSNTGPFNDGHQVVFQNTPEGRVATVMGPNGQPVSEYKVTPELAQQAVARAYQMARSSLDLGQYDKMFDHDLKQQAAGAATTTANAALLNAQTNEGLRKIHGDYYAAQANQPHYVQDGSGRVLQFDARGGLMGAYGDPRLVGGAGANRGPSEMSWKDRLELDAAIEDRAQQAAAADGKKWKDVGAEQQNLYREQVATRLGVGGTHRIKGEGAPQASPAPSGLKVPYASNPTTGGAPSAAAQSEAPQATVVDMAPAGSSWGSKQYVVTYSDGSRRLESGDDAARKYILWSK